MNNAYVEHICGKQNILDIDSIIQQHQKRSSKNNRNVYINNAGTLINPKADSLQKKTVLLNPQKSADDEH